MKVHRSFENLPFIKNPVVTTGTFDGVHFGHRVILDRLNALAREIDGESVLITFHPHPRRVLYPDTIGKNIKLIASQQEKIQLLEDAGIDHVIIVEFTKEFAKTTSQEFVENLLLKKLGARIIIVGFNHHFGHNKQGDYQYLYEMTRDHDFKVEEISEQDVENETVSSTIIRKALTDGRIQRVNAYLDHLYIIIGKMVDGHERCKSVGFSTFGIEIDEDVKLVPPEGVYAVRLEYESQRFRGMLNIKNSLDDEDPQIQVHLFDYDPSLILKGEITKVSFHKRMRDEMVMDNSDQFQQQLAKDKKEIEELIF